MCENNKNIWKKRKEINKVNIAQISVCPHTFIWQWDLDRGY